MTFDMDSCYKFSSASLNFFFPFYVLVLSLIEVFHSLCCFFCFRFLRNHCRMIAALILRDVFSSLAHSCPSCSLLRCPLLVMSLLLAFQIWQCPWVTRRTTCFFPRLWFYSYIWLNFFPLLINIYFTFSFHLRLIRSLVCCIYNMLAICWYVKKILISIFAILTGFERSERADTSETWLCHCE